MVGPADRDRDADGRANPGARTLQAGAVGGEQLGLVTA